MKRELDEKFLNELIVFIEREVYCRNYTRQDLGILQQRLASLPRIKEDKPESVNKEISKPAEPTIKETPKPVNPIEKEALEKKA